MHLSLFSRPISAAVARARVAASRAISAEAGIGYREPRSRFLGREMLDGSFRADAQAEGEAQRQDLPPTT